MFDFSTFDFLFYFLIHFLFFFLFFFFFFPFGACVSLPTVVRLRVVRRRLDAHAYLSYL